ncbi:MAG: hypothetical protein J6A84_04375 [Clostridia bacterium]|nr:hypothetical protein [Clostridia bacterium]
MENSVETVQNSDFAGEASPMGVWKSGGGRGALLRSFFAVISNFGKSGKRICAASLAAAVNTLQKSAFAQKPHRFSCAQSLDRNSALLYNKVVIEWAMTLVREGGKHGTKQEARACRKSRADPFGYPGGGT